MSLHPVAKLDCVPPASVVDECGALVSWATPERLSSDSSVGVSSASSGGKTVISALFLLLAMRSPSVNGVVGEDGNLAAYSVLSL